MLLLKLYPDRYLRLLHTLVCLWKGLEEQFWLLLLFSYQHFFCYLEFCHSGIILNLIFMLKDFKRDKCRRSRYSYCCFYNPIWTSTIKSELDFALASSLFILLMYFKLPSWAIVLIGIILGVLFY